MTAPDPQTVREIDPRAELPQLQTHHTVYHAYAENEPGWDGEGMYADLETAQRYSAHMHVIFAWDADSTGPLTWRHEGGVWDLLDDGQATGIIIAPGRVYVAPDEQPPAKQAAPDRADGKAFDLDCEELVEIFCDFIGQWDRSHEVITYGLPGHLPQLRIPHLRRAVLALQRLGRERDAALAELQTLQKDRGLLAGEPTIPYTTEKTGT